MTPSEAFLGWLSKKCQKILFSVLLDYRDYPSVLLSHWQVVPGKAF